MNSDPSKPKSAIRMSVEGAFLLLLWLLVAGAATELPGFLGWLPIVAVLPAFLLLNLRFEWPSDLTYSRANQPSWSRHAKYITLISLLLVFADIIWLIAAKRLGDSEPIRFTVALSFIILFPMIEEFGFRLWIQTPLEGVLGKLPSVILVSVAFALVHSSTSPIPQFVASVTLGLALIASGSIWVPVVMHQIQNALLLGLGEISFVQHAANSMAAWNSQWLLVMALICWATAIFISVRWSRAIG